MIYQKAVLACRCELCETVDLDVRRCECLKLSGYFRVVLWMCLPLKKHQWFNLFKMTSCVSVLSLQID